MSIRHWIGEHLRYLADRVDDEHSFRCTGLTMTIEQGKGAVMHTGIGTVNPGVPLWYRNHEYDEAFQ